MSQLLTEQEQKFCEYECYFDDYSIGFPNPHSNKSIDIIDEEDGEPITELELVKVYESVAKLPESKIKDLTVLHFLSSLDDNGRESSFFYGCPNGLYFWRTVHSHMFLWIKDGVFEYL